MIRYAKSHIWVSLIGSMILLFLGLAVIFQNYLKNEYFNYLIAETWKSEQTVLSVASKNLNGYMAQWRVLRKRATTAAFNSKRI